MSGTDAHADVVKKPHHEATSEACHRNAEAAMHRDSERVTPEQRRDVLANSYPDTASKFLKPMELVQNGQPVSDNPTTVPGVTKLPGGGTIESHTDGAGTKTDITRNQYHEMQRSLITRKDGTSTEFEVKPGGFKSTERQADGSFVSTEQDQKGSTVIHHTLDGKGGFTDTTEKSDGTKKVHEQSPTGEYSESNFKNGLFQNQGRYAADGTALPPGAVKPDSESAKPRIASPTDPVGVAENQIEEWADGAVDSSKLAGVMRNLGRIGYGAIGVAAQALPETPVIGTIVKIGGSGVGKAIGGIASPLINGVQAFGGIAKEASGDPEGRHDIAKAVISWGVGGVVTGLAAETGPFAPAIGGAAGLGAGQTYDEIRSGKPITYDEAKTKHDSSWFYKIMEPNEKQLGELKMGLFEEFQNTASSSDNETSSKLCMEVIEDRWAKESGGTAAQFEEAIRKQLAAPNVSREQLNTLFEDAVKKREVRDHGVTGADHYEQAMKAWHCK